MACDKKAAGTSVFLLIAAGLLFGQVVGHLSDAEVKAALSGDRQGFVYLNDMLTSTNLCKAQHRGVLIYTPSGLLYALNVSAKKQFLPFQPTESDTLNALTIIGEGCARATPSGPSCESITRMALLSDEQGGVVAEAIQSASTSEVWQNGFGASRTCSSLMSKFSIDDMKKVQSSRGEFFIAMFDKTHRIKIFEVKEKHLKSLGL